MYDLYDSLSIFCSRGAPPTIIVRVWWVGALMEIGTFLVQIRIQEYLAHKNPPPP